MPCFSGQRHCLSQGSAGAAGGHVISVCHFTASGFISVPDNQEAQFVLGFVLGLISFDEPT